MDLDKSIEKNEDLALLKRIWTMEKFSPQLLKFHKDLFDRIHKQIKIQKKRLSENREKQNEKEAANRLDLYEMEIDRVEFLLNSYLRTRLQKIQKFCLYIEKTDSATKLLSEAENNFAQKYSKVLRKALKQPFLDKLPNEWSDIDKHGAKPRSDKFVFLRALSDLGPVTVSETTGEDELLEDEQLVSRGDVFMANYKFFKILLERGRVELN